MSVSVTIETVTPEMAKQFLRCSNRNRRIDPRLVDMIARDIRNGKWEVTNQGVGFDKNGEFKDGHHRCLGIIKANTPVQMMVARGMEPTAVLAIDRGNTRKVRDVLDMSVNHIDGRDSILCDKSIVCAINQLVRCTYGRVKLSAYETIRVFNALEGPITSMHNAMVTKQNYRQNTAPVIAAAIAAVACGVDPEAVGRFFGVFNKGDVTGCEGMNINAPMSWRHVIDAAKVKHVRIDQKKLYLGTQNAIFHFVNNTDAKTARVPSVPRYDVSKRISEALEIKDETGAA